jgi:hypothetical protein
LPSNTPDEFFKSLSMLFETTMDMLEEIIEKHEIDLDSFDDSDFETEYDRMQLMISNDAGAALAKQYGKQVKDWLDSLEKKNAYGMEIRLQDEMFADCFEVIQWYQHMLEVKYSRALMAQTDEVEAQLIPYDSLGNAKLLLVSIERNIGAWGYVYQKCMEDEDEILDILVCLQKLCKKIEQKFPEARAFIRPGLDE